MTLGAGVAGHKPVPRFTYTLGCVGDRERDYRIALIFPNFANLESFAKFIQLKFEPLRYHTHGQLEFAKFFQRIPSKQQIAKI